MSSVLRCILILVFTGSCLPVSSLAGRQFSLNVGLGASSHHSEADNPWLSFSTCATLQSDRTLFLVRYVREHRFDLEISIMGGGGFHNKELTQELALLGGFHRTTGQSMSMEMAAGVGLVTGNEGAKYSSDGVPISTHFAVPGGAFHAAVYWRHIGIVVLGDLNSAQSFGGIQLSFRFGPWPIRSR